jgi:hypothetical protein
LVSVYTALPWLSTRIVPFEVLAVLTTAAEAGAVVLVADDFFEDFELLLEPPQAASPTTATTPSATTARAIFVPPLIAPRFMSRPLHDHAGMGTTGEEGDRIALTWEHSAARRAAAARGADSSGAVLDVLDVDRDAVDRHVRRPVFKSPADSA